MAKITAIRIKDILNAEVDVGPFFGSLRVTTRYFSDQSQFAGSEPDTKNSKPPVINYLWRHDAIKLHSMLQGYIIACQKEIECSEIAKEELVTLLHDLGQSVSPAS